MADGSADVRRLAAQVSNLRELDGCVSVCRACDRLVAWRETVAAERRRAYADQDYWGRPVPGFGPAHARVLVVGLAPAAHGANRTGRMFTGDRSGDWLYTALYRAGLASQPTSVSIDDGLVLYGVRIAAAVKCAPPENKPTRDERDRCAPWLQREVALLMPTLRTIVALGSFAWASTMTALRAGGFSIPTPRPKFGHGHEYVVVGDRGSLPPVTVIGSYHPSQQNTFTGRVTEPMLDAVFERAVRVSTPTLRP